MHSSAMGNLNMIPVDKLLGCLMALVGIRQTMCLGSVNTKGKLGGLDRGDNCSRH